MTLDRVSTPEEMLLERVTAQAQRVERMSKWAQAEQVERVQLRYLLQEAHRAGHSYRAIAQAAGISHQRVAQLVQKEEK